MADNFYMIPQDKWNELIDALKKPTKQVSVNDSARNRQSYTTFEKYALEKIRSIEAMMKRRQRGEMDLLKRQLKSSKKPGLNASDIREEFKRQSQAFSKALAQVSKEFSSALKQAAGTAFDQAATPGKVRPRPSGASRSKSRARSGGRASGAPDFASMASSVAGTTNILKDFSTSMQGIVSGINDVFNATLPALVDSIGTVSTALDDMAEKLSNSSMAYSRAPRRRSRGSRGGPTEASIIPSVPEVARIGANQAESLISSLQGQGAQIAQALEPTIEKIGETLQRYMMGMSQGGSGDGKSGGGGGTSDVYEGKVRASIAESIAGNKKLNAILSVQSAIAYGMSNKFVQMHTDAMRSGKELNNTMGATASSITEAKDQTRMWVGAFRELAAVGAYTRDEIQQAARASMELGFNISAVSLKKQTSEILRMTKVLGITEQDAVEMYTDLSKQLGMGSDAVTSMAVSSLKVAKSLGMTPKAIVAVKKNLGDVFQNLVRSGGATSGLIRQFEHLGGLAKKLRVDDQFKKMSQMMTGGINAFHEGLSDMGAMSGKMLGSLTSHIQQAAGGSSEKLRELFSMMNQGLLGTTEEGLNIINRAMGETLQNEVRYMRTMTKAQANMYAQNVLGARSFDEVSRQLKVYDKAVRGTSGEFQDMAKMGADWAQAAAQYGKDNADAMLQSTDIGITGIEDLKNKMRSLVSGPGVENILQGIDDAYNMISRGQEKAGTDLLNRTLQLASSISQQAGDSWSYDAASFMEKLSKDAAEMQDSFRDQGMGMVEARTKTFEVMQQQLGDASPLAGMNMADIMKKAAEQRKKDEEELMSAEAKAMSNFTDTLNRIDRKIEETFGNLFGFVSQLAEWSPLLANITGTLMAFGSFTLLFSSLYGTTAKVIDFFGKATGATATAIEGLNAVGTSGMAAGGWLSKLWKGLQWVGSGLIAPFVSLGKALLFLSIPAWVAVAAVAALGVAIWYFWDEISGAIKYVWHGVTGAIESVWNWVKSWWSGEDDKKKKQEVRRKPNTNQIIHAKQIVTKDVKTEEINSQGTSAKTSFISAAPPQKNISDAIVNAIDSAQGDQSLKTKLFKETRTRFADLPSMQYSDIEKNLAEIAKSTRLSADQLKGVGISLKDSYFEQVKQNKISMDGFGRMDAVGQRKMLEDKKAYIERIAKEEKAYSAERALMESGNKSLSKTMADALPLGLQEQMLNTMSEFKKSTGRNMTVGEIFAQVESKLSDQNKNNLKAALKPWMDHESRMANIDKQKTNDLATINRRMSSHSASITGGRQAVSQRQAQHWAAGIDKIMGISGGKPQNAAMANEWAMRKSRGQFKTYDALVAAAKGEQQPASTTASQIATQTPSASEVAWLTSEQAKLAAQMENQTTRAATQNTALTTVGAGSATSDSGMPVFDAGQGKGAGDEVPNRLDQQIKILEEQNKLLAELVALSQDRSGGTTLPSRKKLGLLSGFLNTGNAHSQENPSPWLANPDGVGANR